MDDMNLNNQVSQADAEAERFHCAMNEVFSLLRKQNRGGVVIGAGFIFCTHGLIFELTGIGWVLRPNNYLHNSEVAKRYPTTSRRARFYRMRRAQKQWLKSL